MTARILLLDADPQRSSRTAAAIAELAAEAVEIVTATSGREAIERASEGRFELVIAELVLPRPDLGGASALRRVAEQYPGCRTILVSDHTGVASLVQGAADTFVVRRGTEAHELARQALELLEASMTPTDASDASSISSTGITALGPQALPPGEYLAGKYRLVERIGRGGMGVVYRAEDTFIQRPVAVKRIEMHKAVDPGRLARRLHREVRIAGRLRHPNIVTLYDAGLEDGEAYLVMELIEGRTLREHLRERGVLPPTEAVAIAREVLAALEHAHGQGVIHRDLKPSNVLLGESGEVKVADFGVAQLLSLASSDDEKALRDSPTMGEISGTVAYMAPEQMVGESVDPRTDLYALGTVLFEMLHGRSLASLSGPYARAAAHHAGRRPPALPRLRGHRALDQVLERALAVDREERYTTARELAAALDRADRPGWRRFWPWFRDP